MAAPDTAVPTPFVIQRQAAAPVPADDDVFDFSEAAMARAGESHGQPLPGALAADFGRSLGADLSGVRVHTDEAAGESAQAVSARAFATGSDIYFAPGSYDPSSADGQRLIAHEVVHTVQQAGTAGAPQSKSTVSQPGDSLEVEADSLADAMLAGASVRGQVSTGAAGIQRDGEPTTRRGRARARHAERDADVERAPSTDDTPGRAVGGSTGSDDPGPWHDRQEGGRSYGTGRDEESGAEVRTEDIDERRRTVGPGGLTATSETGTRIEEMDGAAMAADLDRRLEADQDTLYATPTDGYSDEERERYVLELRRITSERAELAALGDDPDARDVVALAERRRLPLEPRYRTSAGDVTRRETTVDTNPLDGTVGASRTTRRDIVDGNLDVTETDSRSVRADLGAGRLDETESRVVRVDDGSETMTSTESRRDRAAVGGGSLTASRRRSSEMRVDDSEGRLRERTSEASEDSAGAIVTDDELGVRLGSTRRTEREDAAGSSSTETASSTDVTDRRVAHRRSTTRDVRRGDWAGQVRTSADGSFSIDIEPMDDGSGRYRLTFTIHAGVGVGGHAERSRRPTEGAAPRPRGGHVRASASASAEGDVVTSRLLTEEQAQQYLDAADRADAGGTPPSHPPEFGSLARLRAAGEHADTIARSLAALGSSDTAAAMADGESSSVSLTVRASAGIAGGFEGAGWGVEGEASRGIMLQRTLQVERADAGDQHRVRITVSYTRTDEGAAGAGVTAAGAAMAARRSGSDTEGESVRFVLDPDDGEYGTRYDEIVATTDLGELRTLAARPDMRTLVSRSTRTTGTEGTDTLEAGLAGARLAASERTHHREVITTGRDDEGNPDSLSGTITGGTDQTLGIVRDGESYGSAGSHESATGRVDDAGDLTVDVEEENSSSDPIRAAREAASEFAEDDARGRVSRALARSPSEHLRHLLTEQYAHLRGYHLNEHDLEVLAQRATDQRRWSHCCVYIDAIQPWRTLRARLIHPRTDAAEDRIDHEIAVKLATARAITRFMETAGGRGMEVMEIALRRWGESRTRQSTAERLGRGYEWPSSLSETRTRYEGLESQLEHLEGNLTRYERREGGAEQGHDVAERLIVALQRILRELDACHDFESEAQRAELVEEIEGKRAEVERIYNAFRTRREALDRGEEPPETAIIERTDDETAEETRVRRERSATRTRLRSIAAVRALQRVLARNHERERQLLREATGEIPSGEPSVWNMGSGSEAVHLCAQVADMHATWIRQIEDLRQAYFQAGIPEEDWEVSTGPDAPRNYELEPNIGWVIRLYERAERFDPLARTGPIVAGWRERARY